MKIHGLTVCVNYSDLLRKGIEHWKRGLDSLMVVTTEEDEQTRRLCDSWDITAYTTNVFYDDGAHFNKGRAISQTFEAVEWPDWCLFFDADIIPTPDWREAVEKNHPQFGNLYGCHRETEGGFEIHDGELAGFFQMFHSMDPNALVRPIVDTCWSHAGAYDSYFMKRWKPEERIILPIYMTHQGLPGENWCGRGNEEEMTKLLNERARRGGHQHERISPLGIA